MRWLVATLSMALCSIAWAESYPSRPIRMIVPYPAGGSTDILARAIQQPMSELLGQPIVIDNRGGAGGIIGTEAAARSTPDGYTLVFGNLGPNAINASTRKTLSYDPIKDFAPVSVVANMPMFLVVNPKLPVRSIAELVALARSKPGELAFASVGTGSASHVTGELFNSMAGVKLLHVPYRGGAPAVNDVLAGHVPIMFVTSLEGANHIKEGGMIALGGTPKRRTPVLPDVPAIGETVPGFDVVVWFGVLAPANTPRYIVEKLNGAIKSAVAATSVQDKLKSIGVDPVSSSSAEFAEIIATDVAKWAKLVKEAGLAVGEN